MLTNNYIRHLVRSLTHVFLLLPLSVYSVNANTAIDPQLLHVDHTSVVNNAVIIGDAYALGSNQLLYTEFHSFNDRADESDTNSNQHRVSYLTADNQPLADKIIIYQQNLAAPEFHQTNHHTQTELSVQWQDDALRMRLMPNGFDKVINPATKLPVVIDAGFHMFIRQHWDALINRETKVFNFAFAKRGSMIHMRISRTTCDPHSKNNNTSDTSSGDTSSSDTSSSDTNAICLVLEPDNWVFKMLAPTTQLTYSQDKTLLRYRGLSNIDTLTGDNQLVDIRYRQR